MKRILLTVAACASLAAPLPADDQKGAESMQCCCMKCCMKNKHGDTAKANDAAKRVDAELNELIDEFKEASKDRRLDILSTLLSKLVEQRKATEENEHEHSAH